MDLCQHQAGLQPVACWLQQEVIISKPKLKPTCPRFREQSDAHFKAILVTTSEKPSTDVTGAPNSFGVKKLSYNESAQSSNQGRKITTNG